MTGNQQNNSERILSCARKIEAEVSASGRSFLKELKDSLAQLPVKKEILLQISETGVAKSLKSIQSALTAVGKKASGYFSPSADPETDDARTDHALREARRIKGDDLSGGEIETVRHFADLTRRLEVRTDGTRNGRSAELAAMELPARGGLSGAENPFAGGRSVGEFRRQTEFLEKIYNILDRLEQ